MERIRVGIIGNGWRTGFYLRVIDALPDTFELTGMLFRNSEKASRFAQERPGKAFTDLDKFLAQNPDYVILCVRGAALAYSELLYPRGVPVLTETPAANGLEELTRLWELKQRYDARVQVFEHCHLFPYQAAVREVVRSGLLGEVHSLRISMLHDYHAVSNIRLLLGVQDEPCAVDARLYHFPVTATCGRGGMDSSGEVNDKGNRKVATFRFESGKTAFYDFCNDQYFNYIHTRHMQVWGSRGEICDNTVNFLNEENLPVTLSLHRVDLGRDGNLEGYCHRGILLGERFVYQNPFAEKMARLNDDEIATAQRMLEMGRYVRGGAECYPLCESLQDTYLALLMDQAIATGQEQAAQPQAWHGALHNR